MSAQHLEVIETTVQKTHQWLGALADELHLDTHTAYQVLRSVLHTLRDRLPREEAAQLAAQLPMLLRGLFYEGWRPSGVPMGMNREEFLDRISRGIECGRIISPVDAAKAALRVMDRMLSQDALIKVSEVLPAEIRGLFPGKVESPAFSEALQAPAVL